MLKELQDLLNLQGLVAHLETIISRFENHDLNRTRDW